MNKLNPQQKKAADFYEGICAVIAIPGSGKTMTMTERIGRLVKHHKVSPECILALSFTRNAAQSMKDRLFEVLDDVASKVTLSTIHSFCLRLLRTEGKNFDLLTGKEQIIFMRKILQKMQAKDLPTGMVLRDISLAKNNLISVDEFYALYEGDSFMVKVADVYKAYEEEKEKEMLLDLDDLLFEAYRLLSEDHEVRQKYQQAFPHILVDEVQDTNPAQMEILKLLVEDAGKGSKKSFWVCGDDFQAVFSFQGANVSNILNFDRIFPESHQVLLDLNYRSTPQILRVCQNLMRHNARKIQKEMNTHNGDGEEVVIFEGVTEWDEAQQLVNEILDLVNRRGFVFKDIAVLYRANFQSRVIEDVFSEHEIPFFAESLSFYQRHEIKLLLDYLRLINNPDSEDADEALKSIINVPNRYVSKTFMSEIEAHAISKGVHFYQGLKSMRIKVPYLRANIKDLISLIDPLIKKAREISPQEMLQILRQSLDYDRFIADDAVPSADDVKIDNLEQLEAAASSFKDLATFLAHTESFTQDTGKDREGVHLMTVHKAKGLQFPVVFAVGLMDGFMPNKHGDIEEERRIAFVAFSRAMKLLYLSHSTTYLGKPVQPSVFLSEIQSPD